MIFGQHPEVYMDYHLQFRLKSMQQASGLGQPKFNRYPLSGGSPDRPACGKDGPPSVDRKAHEPSLTPAQPEVEGDVQREEDSPEIQAQVRQLRFWLKVLSRFCQDRPGEE